MKVVYQPGSTLTAALTFHRHIPLSDGMSGMIRCKKNAPGMKNISQVSKDWHVSRRSTWSTGTSTISSYESPLGNRSFTPGFYVMIFFPGSPVMAVTCYLVVWQCWHSHFSQLSNSLSGHFDHPQLLPVPPPSPTLGVPTWTMAQCQHTASGTTIGRLQPEGSQGGATLPPLAVLTFQWPPLVFGNYRLFSTQVSFFQILLFYLFISLIPYSFLGTFLLHCTNNEWWVLWGTGSNDR